MLFKKFSTKKFEYLPRYYKPELDQEERKKQKLGFKKNLEQKRKQKNPLWLILLFVIIVYFFLKFQGMI
jgi:cytoskeletal protein RodZ